MHGWSAGCSRLLSLQSPTAFNLVMMKHLEVVNDLVFSAGCFANLRTTVSEMDVSHAE
jgi:hypothetical protein